eukprot:scaffold20942_cov113-Isochrysis_galbana.AAC.2
MPPILRLRPATAAGRLLQFFASKLPFGAAPPPRLFGARASAGEGRLHLDDRVFYARPLELVHDPVWMQKGERRVQELPLVREGAELRDVAAEVHEGGGANAEEQRLPALAGVPRRDVEFGRGGAASELGQRGWWVGGGACRALGCNGPLPAAEINGGDGGVRRGDEEWTSSGCSGEWVGGDDLYAVAQDGMNAPKSGVNAPKGGVNAPTGGVNAPQGGANAPQGGVNAPQGGANALKGGVNALKGGVNAPQGGVNAPEGGVNAPQGGVNAPQGGVNAPKGGVNAPEGGVNAPEGGVNALKGGVNAPQGGVNAPQGGVNAPQGGVNAPQGGVNAPKGGVNALKGGVNAPQGGVNAPQGGVNAPQGGVNAPGRQPGARTSVPPSRRKRSVTRMLPMPRHRMVCSLLPSAGWAPLTTRTRDDTPGSRRTCRSAPTTRAEARPPSVSFPPRGVAGKEEPGLQAASHSEAAISTAAICGATSARLQRLEWGPPRYDPRAEPPPHEAGGASVGRPRMRSGRGSEAGATGGASGMSPRGRLGATPPASTGASTDASMDASTDASTDATPVRASPVAPAAPPPPVW